MILAIDTSAGTEVAVVESDGAVVASAARPGALGHAEAIGELLLEVLESAPPPTHVAAGMGPGPFTGLRIGIAAARTFALGRFLPVVPVMSHDAVAAGVLIRRAMTDAPSAPFAVVTDARRRELAVTVYDGLDDDGLPVRVAEPTLSPRDTVDGLLAARGVERIDADRIPAALIGLVAARAIAAGRSVATDQAVYLRAPDVTVSTASKRVTP